MGNFIMAKGKTNQTNSTMPKDIKEKTGKHLAEPAFVSIAECWLVSFLYIDNLNELMLTLYS